MQLKKTWFEKLDEMITEECLPLEGSPKASVYSAIRANRKKLNGRRFRIQQDEHTGQMYVCRAK